MHFELIRGIKPTQRRWLFIGRAHDGHGHLQGFTLCWWTGMVIVLVNQPRRPKPTPESVARVEALCAKFAHERDALNGSHESG